MSPNSIKSRFHSKSKKDRFETSSTIHLYRDGISDTTKYRQTTTRSYGIPTPDNQKFLTQTQVSARTFLSLLNKLSAAADSSSRQTSFTPAPNVYVVSLETSTGSSSFSHQYDLISFEMVDGHQLLHSENIHSPSRSQCVPFYRCQSLWMGSSSWADETVLSWSLDRRPIPASFQYTRNNGHSFCTEEGHTVYTPLLCYDIHRQYNSGLIYQQTRRNTFSQTMHRSLGNPPLVPGTWHNPQIRHIPGKFNILQGHLSRLDKPLNREWSLNQMVANCMFQMLSFPKYRSPVTRHRSNVNEDWPSDTGYQSPGNRLFHRSPVTNLQTLVTMHWVPGIKL